MSAAATLLFAGGGTGGHVYPNIAILEQLRRLDVDLPAHFLLSDRPLDQRIAAEQRLDYTPLPARPFSARPWRWPGFVSQWRRSVREAVELIRSRRVVAVVGTGGFITAPAIAAARKCGVTSALVNLDAVPGRANRYIARRASARFTVYPHASLRDAHHIGMPLRRAAIGPADRGNACRDLGLDPVSEMLLVVGGSSGARSINRMMLRLIDLPEPRGALRSWQVLHLCGPEDREALAAAYTAAGINARIEPAITRMGAAWRAASFAISRAGAGAVAEAWANTCPTIFIPYPFHRDQHQKHNARPLVEQGAAELVEDPADPEPAARAVAPALLALMLDFDRRQRMADALAATCPPNGAQTVAEWIAQHLDG